MKEFTFCGIARADASKRSAHLLFEGISAMEARISLRSYLGLHPHFFFSGVQQKVAMFGLSTFWRTYFHVLLSV
jgi:hypothetical protein